jgi:hypothetical protein
MPGRVAGHLPLALALGDVTAVVEAHPVSEFHASEPARGVNPDGAVPRRVILAFRLWWPLIIAQALFFIFLLVVFVAMIVRITTIPDAGPAEGIVMLFLVPLGVLVLTPIAAEIPLVFHLRRGSRNARAWLLALAILTGLVAAWQLAASATGLGGAFTGESAGLYIAVGIALTAIFVTVASLALIGAVLPFRGPDAAYFSKPRSILAPAQSPTVSPTDRPS